MFDMIQSWVTVSQSVVENVFTVRDLKPAAKYVFVVRARNVFGVSGPSPPSDLIEIDRECQASFLTS